MSGDIQLTGFAELDAVLEELEKHATRKASARRALRRAAQPMADLANQLKPDDPRTSGTDDAIQYAVSTVLSPRQRRLHRRLFRDDRAAVEMFVGALPNPAAVQQEFGNVNHPPQPSMRPSWDQDHRALLDRLSVELRADLERTIARARRRAARG